MTGQQYPTREQIAEPAADELFDLALDGGGTRGDALLRIYRRGVEDVFALLPQPTQECGVCGRQYPADDPHDTCPVCWPGFGEHGQQPTPSAEPTCTCGHIMDDHDLSETGECQVAIPWCPCTSATNAAAPVDIASMAPGTTFVDSNGERWTIRQDREGEPWANSDTGDAWDLDDFDPSTIRDVTPPPATPEAD